jgi:hypothetical protein
MAGSTPDVHGVYASRSEFRERQRVELTGGRGGSSPLEFRERQRVELTRGGVGGRPPSGPSPTYPSGFRTSVCVVAAATAFRVSSIGHVRSVTHSSTWSA